MIQAIKEAYWKFRSRDIHCKIVLPKYFDGAILHVYDTKTGNYIEDVVFNERFNSDRYRIELHINAPTIFKRLRNQ